MRRRRATRKCSQRAERTSNKKVFTGRKAAKEKAMRRPNLMTSKKLTGMETKASLTVVTT